MSSHSLSLSVLPDEFAIVRLEHCELVPGWALSAPFVSITRSGDELSIVCKSSFVPDGLSSEGGYRCLKVEGPLDFSETGILASLASPLAGAGVSIFAISTFETDYILVRSSQLEAAHGALEAAGHRVVPSGRTGAA